MNRFSVVTFGEIMLRLTPTTNWAKLVKANSLAMDFAGAESNVAIALSQWGHPVSFVSALPQNALGDGAENLLREFGVNTEFVTREGNRIGIYFIEQGASLRPSRIIYDRDDSSFQQIAKDAIVWEEVLEDKRWLHLTGISPALSPNCAHETIRAAKIAQEKGLRVSFDLNFRRKLWKSGAEAIAIFNRVLEHTDVLIANEGALMDVYQMGSDKSSSSERCRELMPMARDRFKVSEVVFTERNHISASHNKWTGILYDGGKFYESPTYDLELVDRIGGGDAFAAGLIHGYGKEWSFEKTIKYATAASALQQTIPGDLNLVKEEEVKTIMEGHTSGHVER